MQLCLEKLIKAVQYTALSTWPEGRGVVCFWSQRRCIGTAIEVCPVTAAKHQPIKILYCLTCPQKGKDNNINCIKIGLRVILLKGYCA